MPGRSIGEQSQGEISFFGKRRKTSFCRIFLVSFQYEWQIEGKWEGALRKGDSLTRFQGTFEIPNLSDENTIDEVTMTFAVDKTKGEKLKEMLRKDGPAAIRKQMAEYVRLLKEEFSQGLILPTKDSTNERRKSRTTETDLSSFGSGHFDVDENSRRFGITRSENSGSVFQCSKIELFKTFCDLERVRAFTHNSVSVSTIARKEDSFPCSATTSAADSSTSCLTIGWKCSGDSNRGRASIFLTSRFNSSRNPIERNSSFSKKACRVNSTRTRW